LIVFWQRRDLQPIKARLPTLVVGSDIIIFFFWVLILCLQRIYVETYPCLVNVWSGFIGIIILFNTYLWRCWVLFFTFQLTQERLEGRKKAESTFLKNRFLISHPFLIKFVGTLTVILNLPCALFTAGNEDLPNLTGDNCNKGWSDQVLAGYVVGYVVVFLFFAFKLRQVVDGFKIKEELKVTGVIAIVIVIPWILFNSVVKTINNEVFPFSTFFLILGVSAAFCVSTLWPLYRSYFAPPNIEASDVPEDLTTLQGLLSHKAGIASFKKFLTKEFSVENILFFEEIEEYRKKKKEGGDEMELIGEAQRIYAKYIIVDSPFQVNLPDNIVKDVESKLKDIFSNNAGKIPESPTNYSLQRHLSDAISLLPNHQDTPTIFDKAQENIFKLMSTDSFPRYFRSDEYTKLCATVAEKKKNAEILRQEGVIDDRQTKN